MSRVLLPCRCGERLWVRIGTAGGHHTEAWPAHECLPREQPAPALLRMAGPGERGCVDCGVSLDGTHRLVKRCGPCSRAERKRIDARSVAQRRARLAERLVGVLGEVEA